MQVSTPCPCRRRTSAACRATRTSPSRTWRSASARWLGMSHRFDHLPQRADLLGQLLGIGVDLAGVPLVAGDAVELGNLAQQRLLLLERTDGAPQRLFRRVGLRL